MIKTHLYRLYIAAVVMALFTTSAASQESWPSSPVRIVVPYAPGGSIDILARQLSNALSEILNATFVVENKSGAAGAIGTQYVASQPADGYTFLFTTVSHTLAPSLRDLPFDPQKDFVAVINVADSPQVLIRNPSLKVETLQELINMAKSQPGKLSYGHSGHGAPANIAMELLKSKADIDILGIPYKGAGPVVTAVRANEVPLGMASLPAVASLLSSGQIAALGVSTPQRNKLIPQVPTFAESGVPGYNFNTWLGLVAKVGTPKEDMAKLVDATNEALANPKILKAFTSQGFDTVGGTSKDFELMLNDEFARWPALLKEAGIEKQQ
ncbi:Bug family tripartite tricarboxylate transporter substrate binding protein [Allopusillimonas soli]|uniref:Tripartite tricarboxylate transporter substrate binding protein n=1 Tax=Allopusillimonas soli TaxID=659016 RepID=A0A853FK37_9BURK|nr:tripartite tricarboxylate transporter substrate binding protein [Allopusillimonas soli]NYT38731.1 tripartite tricarboxylate transporter substrate binding protein [Allopusillimonas soli]